MKTNKLTLFIAFLSTIVILLNAVYMISLEYYFLGITAAFISVLSLNQIYRTAKDDK
ncbi:hypothetical protein [Pontimicrobium aquaticum]|uniref:hypothetical protein n=1 Tax=Pontimicrobium aquaticum TaxID=2565367 RepID=UPI00145D033D|nr:hypothetical protein [Pontimicrobium aquaticum]